MNLRFKYPLITYNDLVDSMGLTETPIISTPAPGPQWPFQAFITMGGRCHGDAISPDYLNLIKAIHGNPPTGDGAWLVSNYWARCAPWAGIVVGANNKCTNAGVHVFDTQLQYFSRSQQKWILMSTIADRNREWTSSYYTNDYTTIDGTSTLLRPSRFNLAAHSPVKVSGDRTTEDDPTTPNKYRILHSSLLDAKRIVDVTDIEAIFVSASMRLISIDGNPFNSTSIEIMGQVGADYYPQEDFAQNQGYLTGISSTPAVGTGCFKLLPTDGSTKRLYFISADINANTFIQSSSVYVLANGPKSQCMTSTKLRDNIPQLKLL